MKKLGNRLAVYAISGCLLTSVFTVVPETPFTIEAEAHSGRTDANGGHRDNKNRSGLGSYHYHCGGYPPHLHTDGVCPYKSGASTEKKTTTDSAAQTQPAAKETEAETQTGTCGWQQEAKGWCYRTEDNQFCKNGWKSIDGQWYYFDADGYMVTGWLYLGDEWYYLASDGHMVTGELEIDGTRYYFESDGELDEDYYDGDFSDD